MLPVHGTIIIHPDVVIHILLHHPVALRKTAQNYIPTIRKERISFFSINSSTLSTVKGTYGKGFPPLLVVLPLLVFFLPFPFRSEAEPGPSQCFVRIGSVGAALSGSFAIEILPHPWNP